jgi:hypothetical protein
MQPMGGIPGAAPMVHAGGYGARGAHGPVGNVRNPVMTTVIGMVCFVYALFVLFSELNELKAYRQKDDINPILMFVPILNLLMIWNLPEKVLDAKRMAGIPNPQVVHPVLYLFLSPYFLTNDLNEIFQASGAPPAR